MQFLSIAVFVGLCIAGIAGIAGCETVPRGEAAEAHTPGEAAVERNGSVEIAEGFDDWLVVFRNQAQREGIEPELLDRAFRGLQPNPRILALDQYQPEFERPIWEYLASAVSENRVNRGRRLLSQHRATLLRVAGHYGVPPEYLVAIWGIETDYGRNLGDLPVIQSMATLAYQGRRRGFGREQLTAALRIAQHGDMELEDMVGSWAGAMGQTQFIPTTYLAYAVDFDGDGRRDLINSLEDALASTAHYLGTGGWRKDQPWGVEVMLPDGFDLTLADPEVRLPIEQWHAQGVTLVPGPVIPGRDQDAQLIIPAGHQGASFLVLDNFRMLLRYNNATSYALAVGHLADRIGGGGALSGSWPVWERPLSLAERFELQRLLDERGYDSGPSDGIIGPRTRQAVRRFQQAQSLPPDGFPTQSLLDRLRAG